MKKIKICRILFAALLFVVSISEVSARSLEEIQKDALTVAVRRANFPFGIINKDEQLSGVEFDLISEIVNRLGVQTHLFLDYVDSLEEAEKKLQANEIDMIISTVKISKSLQDRFAVSEPYYQTGLSLLTLKENTEIYSLTSLNGKYVATTLESGAEKLLVRYVPMAKLEVVKNHEDAINLLKNDDVDAVINDKVLLIYSANNDSSFRVSDLLLTEDNYVVVVNKKSKDLLSAINKAINEMRTKRTRSDVSPLEQIFSKYGLQSTISPILN